jgi:hypothetical protein
VDARDADAVRRSKDFCAKIVSRFTAEVQSAPLSSFGWHSGAPEALVLERLAIRNISPDSAKREIENLLISQASGAHGGTGRRRLAHFGLFIPRTGSVTCHSFAHGHGHYYRYRVASFKLDSIPSSLKDFLVNLPDRCPPNEKFLTGPRASSVDISLTIAIERSSLHPMIQGARDGLEVRKLKSAHEDLEKYFLERDPETIACEVPIWFEPNEQEPLVFLKSDAGMLTGHIDVLRCQGDQIAVWDYKPSAANETKAHVQVFLYTLMLSKRTGIALERFKCGYFDSNDAFFFNPAEVSSP